MSKKDDLLSPEERAKKYGNEIMGIGVFYLVVLCILIALSISKYLANPINWIIIGIQVIILKHMIIGGKKRNRAGVKAAIAFEIYMIVTSIISIAFLRSGPDIVAFLVMIFLPFDIKGLSKALNDMENRGDMQPQNNTESYDNMSIQNDNNDSFM